MSYLTDDPIDTASLVTRAMRASDGVSWASEVRSPVPAGLWTRSASAPTVGIDAVTRV